RQRLPQTSDGVPGEIAPPIPRGLAGRRNWVTLTDRRIVPGVRFQRFTITDYRGPIRGQLVRVDPAAPGVRIDYTSRPYVASAAPLGSLLGPRAVAAVNGDFFDIGATNAPLGVGRDRERGALHGVMTGWNAALYVDRHHTWRIGPISTIGTVVQHPRLRITSFNSPRVRPGEIGLYTGRWGATRNYRLSSDSGPIRTVLVRGGRVAANYPGPPSTLRAGGQLLVGTGRGAAQLAPLRRGSPVTVRVRYTGQPRVALTGNTRILLNGTRLSIDDREMHPRTAVGIDRDTGQILMLVIDGRQSFSRGYTMVELATLMKELGAEDAINLDGGGSSTIMGLTPYGEMAILNSPSDGVPRPIPNGLQVLYTPSRR
ncbi:MAG: phosphodiester glycosidase family protein, partial [Actinomycetota bacterium]|nr:phosphodiester glycosidase family protein [Actinomycetota bacterium]